MRDLLDKLGRGEELTPAEIAPCFARLVAGNLSEIELTALLLGLKFKGETPREIAAAAEAVRAASLPFETGEFLVCDTCGTGGDGAHTINVSTAVALLAAAAGLKVVKHGNRSVSSRCGSADVLEACGIDITAEPARARNTLAEVGICFLFAPQYHSGIRHAMNVRRTLGIRTLFNILGPLLNPARPAYQVLGVYDPALCRPMAETLHLLGCKAALVVHGSGLDEIALHGCTHAALLKNDRIEELVLHPEDAGATPAPMTALRGGDSQENSRWLKELLSGNGAEPHKDVVALNAGALLWISGAASDLRSGFRHAKEVLAAGEGRAVLERWKEACSHGA